MRLFLIPGILTALTAAAVGQTPGFYLTGMPSGMVWGRATALSQDGTTAAGFSAGSSFSMAPGFTWTAAGGRMDFGLDPGAPTYSPAYGMNSNGGVVVGAMVPAGSLDARAYRRVGNGPLENLGTMGWDASYARAVSGDGNTVVGYLEFDDPHAGYFTQAFRWTPQTGMVGLDAGAPGVLTEARGISRDGSTIVGVALFGSHQAFVWHEGTGMQFLPTLPGATSLTSRAEAASADGSIIVGRGRNAAGQPVAVRWTPSGPEELGTLPGTTSSLAFAVSDNGLVVGGSSTQIASVWTPATGMVALVDYLSLFDVVVPSGIDLAYVYAISGDGLTFAGEARIDGVRQGFVATVPAPSGMLVFLATALLTVRRRRATA